MSRRDFKPKDLSQLVQHVPHNWADTTCLPSHPVCISSAHTLHSNVPKHSYLTLTLQYIHHSDVDALIANEIYVDAVLCGTYVF